MWASLLASAMDPKRAGRMRLSFIETLKRFDPLDALVLKKRHAHPGNMRPTAVAGIAAMISEQQSEVEISVENLRVLRCVAAVNPVVDFNITNYGRSLVEVCSG